MTVLYLLTFQNGKKYIGQTVRSLNIRMNQHRTDSKRGSLLPVHCAWRKHGNPVVLVLGEFDTHEDLHRAEIEAIRDMATLVPGGYNVSIGGDTAPSKNPTVAKKISERAKGRKYADTSAWRESSLKQWSNPEYREKVSKGARAAWTSEMRVAAGERSRARWAARHSDGWAMPEATKEKLRQKVTSDETRAKMSISAKARGVSPQALEKAIEATKGKKRGPYSDDRKQKAAAGVRAAWQDPEKRERLMAARKTAWETRRAKNETV